MSNPMVQLQEATIKAQCKTLRMPMVAWQFGTLAEPSIPGQAVKTFQQVTAQHYKSCLPIIQSSARIHLAKQARPED
jgi:hypothetical protein